VDDNGNEHPITSIESMDAKQQMQNRLYKSEMIKAASKFNLKWKNGLKYLTDKGLLAKEPKEAMLKGITKFLKETPSLSATAIGQFMGEDKELNKDVLSMYIDEMDFTSKELSFAGCMKMMLTGFRIPGEGQQIDRFMEKFGEKLSRDRPDEFGNTEGVYLLSYATLML
jgi:brefeldin A-inhibited guanine nucleotide-exchange protein